MARDYRTAEEIAEGELLLRGKWLGVKLQLTDWLAETCRNMPQGGDHKAIKCIVDSLNQLDKLIGADTSSDPVAGDMMPAVDRTKSILDKLPTPKA